jgi:hypothetical protein
MRRIVGGGRGVAALLAVPAPLLLLVLARGAGLDLLGVGAAVLSCVVGPGALIALAASRASRADALFAVRAIVAGIALTTLALAVAQIAGLGIGGVTALSIGAGLAAMGVAVARGSTIVASRPDRHALVGVALIAAAGVAGWRLSRFSPLGDAGFHLGRVRLLLEGEPLRRLGLTELIGGTDHPGYAIPGWHAVVAQASSLADLDPQQALPAIAGLGALGAATVAYALGGTAHPVLRSPAVIAGLVLGVWATARWTTLDLPGGIASQVLVPAGLAVAIAGARTRDRSLPLWLAAVAVALVGAKVTYVLPLAAMAVAAIIAESAVEGGRGLVRRAAPTTAAALAALAAPAGLYALWVADIAGQTRAASSARRALELKRRFPDIVEIGPLALLDPLLLVGASTLVAVGVAVAVVGWRPGVLRGAGILGGAVGILAAAYVPPIFAAIAEIATPSQAQRVTLMLPAAALLALGAGGVASLRGRRRLIAIGLTLIAGMAAVLPETLGAPPSLLLVGLLAIAAAMAWLGTGAVHRPTPSVVALAVALLLLPTVALTERASPLPARGQPLPADLAAALEALPAGTGVAASPEVAYRISSATTVPVFSSMPTHVANTAGNAPYRRNAANRRLLRADTAEAERAALARDGGVGAIVALLPGSRRLVDQLDADGWPVLAEGPGWRVYAVP